jgi:hypothetical protein
MRPVDVAEVVHGSKLSGLEVGFNRVKTVRLPKREECLASGWFSKGMHQRELG